MKCKFSQIIADGEHEKLKIMETSTLNKKYIFWLTVQLQKKTCLTGEKFLKPMSITNKISMKAKKGSDSCQSSSALQCTKEGSFPIQLKM